MPPFDLSCWFTVSSIVRLTAFLDAGTDDLHTEKPCSRF